MAATEQVVVIGFVYKVPEKLAKKAEELVQEIRDDFMNTIDTATKVARKELDRVNEELYLSRVTKMCNTSCRQYWNENFSGK